jgi:hypothetical protein
MRQRSPEWFDARCGLATASRFRDVLPTRAAARRTYLLELAAERVTGRREHRHATPAMRWGVRHEAEARGAYEAYAGVLVNEVGMLRHPSLMAAASPDGLVGEDGGVEIKCPSTSTHLATVIDGMPRAHLPQLQGAMWVSGRAWWDFVSYDPRLPWPLCVYVERVPRDPVYISSLALEVESFLGDVAALVCSLGPTPGRT